MNTAVTTASIPASAGQLFEIGHTIGGYIRKLLDERAYDTNRAQKLIKQKGDMKKIAEEIVEKFLQLTPVEFTTSNDVYLTNYKANIQKFYLDVFDIDLSKDQTFIEKELVAGVFTHFMYVHNFIICNVIRNIEKVMVTNSYSYWSDVDTAIKIQQNRPGDSYWMAHEGDIGPDKAHRKKSYNMYSVENTTYMVVREYLLCRLFAYWLKKEIWDKKEVTFTHTLSAGDGVMCGGPSGAAFRLDWGDRDCQLTYCGPRSVVLF